MVAKEFESSSQCDVSFNDCTIFTDQHGGFVNNDCTWLLDTRISHYITSNSAKFTSYVPYNSSSGVMISHGAKVPIHYVGSGMLDVSNNCHPILTYMLHVSNASSSPISANNFSMITMCLRNSFLMVFVSSIRCLRRSS